MTSYLEDVLVGVALTRVFVTCCRLVEEGLPHSVTCHVAQHCRLGEDATCQQRVTCTHEPFDDVEVHVQLHDSIV